MDSSARTTVSCSGLTKSFNGDAVVRDVALNIAEGSIVGLIGPSGCGKTTTVRLLVGLLEPTAGTATVWDTTSTALSAAQRQRIGYLPQIPALFPDLSLWENLSFHASMYGLRMRRRRRLHHVLEWVELDEHRKKKVREVSGGMQRRLALAAAFVHDPMLLFLDEPTAGIDPILRSTFWEQFREMRDEGRTMCVTTQYVGEAAYCDYVGVLSDGELLLVDTPENLRKAAFDGEVVDIELSRAVEAAEVEQLLGSTACCPARSRCRRGRGDWSSRTPTRRSTGWTTRWSASGCPSSRAREHIVDFDEAFVRVIERHRSRDDRDGASGDDGEPTARPVSIRGAALARREHGAPSSVEPSSPSCGRDEAAGLAAGGRPSSRRWRSSARSWPRSSGNRNCSCCSCSVRSSCCCCSVRATRTRRSDCAPSSSGPRDRSTSRRSATTPISSTTTSTCAGSERPTSRPPIGASSEGTLDAVVVFPPDALDQILSGQSAQITVLHETLDPFQQAAIDISSRLAVQEVNASVLGAIAGGSPGCADTGRPGGERPAEQAATLTRLPRPRRPGGDRASRRDGGRDARRRATRRGDVAAGDRAARRRRPVDRDRRRCWLRWSLRRPRRRRSAPTAAPG